MIQIFATAMGGQGINPTYTWWISTLVKLGIELGRRTAPSISLGLDSWLRPFAKVIVTERLGKLLPIVTRDKVTFVKKREKGKDITEKVIDKVRAHEYPSIPVDSEILKPDEVELIKKQNVLIRTSVIIRHKELVQSWNDDSDLNALEDKLTSVISAEEVYVKNFTSILGKRKTLLKDGALKQVRIRLKKPDNETVSHQLTTKADYALASCELLARVDLPKLEGFALKQ